MITNQMLGNDAPSVQKRANIIRYLERITKQDFTNKMDCFLLKEEGRGGVHLREVRKSKGLTQGVLAEILGIFKSYIVQMEAGNKKLSKKAQAFLREDFTKRHSILNEHKSATFSVENK